MITQELTAYVKSELNKGKNKEEIRSSLVSGGGWSEADIAEVFRIVLPGGSTAINIPPSNIPNIPNTTPLVKSISPVKANYHFPWKFLLIALILGALSFSGWYYRDSLVKLTDQVTSMFVKTNKTVQKLPESSPTVPNIPVAPVVVQTVNCGVTNAPDRKDINTYINDPVFKCLGENAILCKNAEAIINDSFFPTIFKITNKNNSCQFSLAYADNSILTDVSGKSLAGRSMFCPLSIVKTMDEKDSKNTVFRFETIDNPNKYAKDIYFYGILGVFIENGFNLNKINGLGCSGAFVNSVIESFELMQKN